MWQPPVLLRSCQQLHLRRPVPRELQVCGGALHLPQGAGLHHHAQAEAALAAGPLCHAQHRVEIQNNRRDDNNYNNNLHNCPNNFHNYCNKCINFCKSINNNEAKFLSLAPASDPASCAPASL